MRLARTIGVRLQVAAMAIGAGLAGTARAADPPEWLQPVAPFRIVGDVYYVGTRGLAAYLIGGKEGAILLDGTLPENARLIERNIEKLGIPLHSVKILLSDHAHRDHVGALARIKHDTGATFVASAADRWSLEHGRTQSSVNYEPKGFPPIHVDRAIGDGEAVTVGTITLNALMTPGHTPGCTSWETTVTESGKTLNVLFLCSITVAGNVLVRNTGYPAIAADYEKTFDKLAATPADVVLTSHPEVADVLGRESRKQAGEVDAFIDPKELPTIVAEAKAAFESARAASSR